MPGNANERPKGLRERNAIATREAIADAAVILAMRHGVEAVRNEDIAQMAGVSPRTFSNYFSNKYEALVFRHTERMNYAAAALRQRPRDEGFWDAVRAAILAPWLEAEPVSEAPSVATIAELKLIFGSRQTQGEILSRALAADAAFAVAIADRLGLDLTQSLYPRLLAAAVTVVTQVAIDAFLQADPPVNQLPLIAEALNQLEAGFPVPIAQKSPE